MLSSTEITPPTDEIEQIASLLSGEPEKATPEVPVDENPEPAVAPEKEEDEANKIDYGMQVPVTNGEPVTLGELKDFYQNQQAATADMIERENAVFRQREELSTLLQYVGELPEHVVKAAQQRAATSYQEQLAILHEIIPEARTPDGAKRMQEAIYPLLAEYGVTKQVADSIKDAQTIKILYDFARLKASIKEARANVKPLRAASVPGQKPPASTNETQQLIARAKATRNSGDEAAAVAALLRSKSA